LGNSLHQADPTKRARLRWRARRGLLENDLIITRFLDEREASLSDQEVGALSALLDLPDNELLDLILVRGEPGPQVDSPEMRRVLAWLRSA
jgi:antitoxin CptB